MARREVPERRSVCPVSCALDLVGDRWTLLVVRDLMAGKTRYRDFAGSPEGIATNILAARLEHLERAGLVHATPSAERRGSRAFSLTPRGRSLRPVLEAIRDWGLANIPGTEARLGKSAPPAPVRTLRPRRRSRVSPGRRSPS